MLLGEHERSQVQGLRWNKGQLDQLDISSAIHIHRFSSIQLDVETGGTRRNGIVVVICAQFGTETTTLLRVSPSELAHVAGTT